MSDLSRDMAGLSVKEDCPEQAVGDVFDGMEMPAFHEQDVEDEPDDMTCAICLERTELVDLALIKGCEHQYCVNCILMWAMCKDWCPQCKARFNYLITYRQLDGTVTDFPSEESVVLLKRAQWFIDYARSKDKDVTELVQAARLAERAATAADAPTRGEVGEDWADLYEHMLDAELEEDEEIESYYFSSAAGRARVVLGNRRLGEGGFMRAGRVYARPAQPARASSSAGGASSSSGGKATVKKGVDAARGDAGGASSSRAAAAAGSSSSCSTPMAVPCSGRASSTTPSTAGSSSSNSATPACNKKKKGKGFMKPPKDVQDFVYGTSPLGRSPSLSRSPLTCGSPQVAAPGSGRRAKRAARRVAADFSNDLD